MKTLRHLTAKSVVSLVRMAAPEPPMSQPSFIRSSAAAMEPSSLKPQEQDVPGHAVKLEDVGAVLLGGVRQIPR